MISKVCFVTHEWEWVNIPLVENHQQVVQNGKMKIPLAPFSEGGSWGSPFGLNAKMVMHAP